MALSKTTLAELSAECERLRASAQSRRKEADQEDAEAADLAALLSRHRRFSEAVTPTPKPTTRPMPSRVADPNGVRATVLRIINEGFRGFTSAEMLDEIQSRHFRDESNSKVSLRARVSNDLGKLHRQRRIGKDRDGRYMALKREGSLL